MLAEPLHITQTVAHVFESLGIRYLIGGSLASSLHGIPRATHDVDLVADVTNRHVPELVKALQATFYVDAEMIREAIHYQRSFNLIHLETMFKIDVFILKPDAISQEEMSRRQPYQLSEDPEETLFSTSAEDIIVHKLVWYQLGGNVSERQWTDVLGVLQVLQQDLDYAYLEDLILITNNEKEFKRIKSVKIENWGN
ncbi:MAG: hypothetical protein ABFR90_11655 [Planctomycetota bacterium]